MLKGAPTFELGERVIYYEPFKMFGITIAGIFMIWLCYQGLNGAFESPRLDTSFGRLVLWSCFVFFCCCLPVVIWKTVKAAIYRVPAIRLTPSGFRDYRCSETVTPWSEVLSIEMVEVGRTEVVGVRITEREAKRIAAGRSISAGLKKLDRLLLGNTITAHAAGTTIDQQGLYELFREYFRTFGDQHAVRGTR